MNNLLHYLLESSACLALFYLGFFLFLRKETYFKLNRIYLVGSLVVSLLLPILKVTSPIFTRQVPPLISSNMSLARVPVALGIQDYLLLIYLTGAALFLLRFLFHMVRLLAAIRSHGVTNKNGIRIVSINEDFSPFSFLNIVFINERLIDDNNMRRIIAHEQIHIKQYHTFDILLVELVTIFQWFNPFVWPYKKTLQETHEFLADHGVIAQGFSAAKYQLLMFEQHVGAKLFEFASNFKQSQIKRRITMMSKNKSRHAAKMKLLLVLPLTAFLLLAFAEPRMVAGTDPGALESPGSHVSLPEANPNSQSTAQEKEKKKQEMLIKAKTELKSLEKEEQKIREKLEKSSDKKAKQELKIALSNILKKQEVMIAYLENGELPPPPPPAEKMKLKDEYKKLKEREEILWAKLKKTEDEKMKQKLKQELEHVLNREAKIQEYMEANGGTKTVPTIDELKKEYTILKAKEADLRAKLEKTENPDDRKKIKTLLVEVIKKQNKIKQIAGKSEKDK